MRYRVNSPQVISETIDGEVVIINLSSGNYYSLRDSGAVIWQALAQTGAGDEVTRSLADCYDGDAEEMSASVERLVAELRKENLIVPDEAEATAPAIPVQSNGSSRAAFAPPVLEKFDDMQDLILLDPVHEVDEATGWPQPDPDP